MVSPDVVPALRQAVAYQSRAPVSTDWRNGMGSCAGGYGIKNFIVVLIFGGLAWTGYQKYASLTAPSPPAPVQRIVPLASRPVPASERATAAPSFTCDGRTRCPQMRSCEEATYFLQHCPGTKMDGDNDGVPCEDQWCS